MSIHRTSNILREVIPLETDPNSIASHLQRGEGRLLRYEDLEVTGTGNIVADVLKVTGTVLIIDQYAEITEITTLTNATDVFATAYDGSNVCFLTKTPGAILSGAPVGSFFTKNKAASETYTVLLADEVRVNEPGNKQAAPFFVTQKNGADTFIRLHLSTTDNPVSFKMSVWFWYYPINGGILEFV